MIEILPCLVNLKFGLNLASYEVAEAPSGWLGCVYAQVRKLVELFSNVPAAAQSVVVRELQLSRMGLIAPEMILGSIEGKLSSLETVNLSACGLRWTNKR